MLEWVLVSLTNLTFPETETQALRAAVAHYGYENLNQFFRVCAHTLIMHHQRGDRLNLPLDFTEFFRTGRSYVSRSYASKKDKDNHKTGDSTVL